MRILSALLLTAMVPAVISAQELVLERFTLLNGDGTMTRNATILIKGNRISAMTKPDPKRKTVMGKGLFITPALIDAGTSLGLYDQNLCEQKKEITPGFSPIGAMDPYDGRFKEVLAGGVGTVAILPGTHNVVSGTAAVLRFTGPEGLPQVARDKHALVATLGTDPQRGNRRSPGTYYYRRPCSRMGTNWVFRQAFHLAGKKKNCHPLMALALQGKLSLRITARPEFDISTALRLADEFGLRICAIDEAPEAYRQAKLLKQKNIPVVISPMSTPTRKDSAEYEIDYIARIARAGVPVAIQTGRGLSKHMLIEEARIATRYGLSQAAAIKAITLVPARILGLSDRLGLIKPGMEADLVIWTGNPLSHTSRPLCVIIKGEIKSGSLPGAKNEEGSR